MLELSNLCHCVQYPWKPTSRDFWSSRNKTKSLSKQKCVLRKCCRVSQKQWMLELSNLCHCVQYPWKPTSRDFWSSRNERKPLSKLKQVLRKWVGYLRNSECWSFQTFAIVFSIPENLLVGISGAVGTKQSHFLIKNVFWEKCCRVSQKQWMLELSNLCYCVQHPWKLTSRDFWSSRNKNKATSPSKMCFEKMLWGISETVNARAFKPLPLCSASMKTY